MAQKNSPTLDETLNSKNNITEIRENIENLRAFLPDDILDGFSGRINKLLEKNPGSEYIIRSEIDKVSLKLEQGVYPNRVRGILNQAANDNFFEKVA